MKFRTGALTSLLIGASICLYSQTSSPQSPPGDTVTPNIPGVVREGTKVQFIKDGFQGTEGPIALPDGSVIFTETNASRITKIDNDGNTSVFLENSNGSNGLAFDRKGRLISVQTTPGKARVGVIYPKGSEKTLADNFEGKPFTRPNDLVVDKKGGVYFTEPANAPAGGPAPALPPAVYYVPPEGGKAIKIAENITFPNGILLSRDEKILYVNDARGENLLAFDVQRDGTVRNRRNFAKYQVADGSRSGADGLAIDADGRLYAATSAGIEVFSSEGKQLGTIKLSRIPQNLAFAGPDKKTLYAVGRGAAFKIPMLTAGFKGRAK